MPAAKRADALPKRNSGGKRSIDESVATDVFNGVPLAATLATQMPPAKKKITYILPHQNMEEGHFYIVLGEDIDVSTKRFKILSLLGEGTFGKVVEAWDRSRKEYCAVKIVRNLEKYTRDAKYEISYMVRVAKADPNDKVPIMKIIRYFPNDTEHMCIVMRKHGPSLLKWIELHGALPLSDLAKVIFDLGVALNFLHTKLELAHTDLKLENILLDDFNVQPQEKREGLIGPEPCSVRVCDLGGCCDEHHSPNAIVSTRHYRSPEVILGLGWMFSTDMWSMGCIIYELVTGRLLYDTHDDLEHLNLMQRTLGPLPDTWHALCSDEMRSKFSNGKLKECTEPSHLLRVARTRWVADVIKDFDLLDLLTRLLRYDRHERIDAMGMISHRFVRKYYPSSVARLSELGMN